MAYGTALVAALVAPALAAQFSGLSPTPDGSSLFFASTLRLKHSEQPLNGKIFLATDQGVTLFQARMRTGVPPNSPACSVGGFSDYIGAETASNGVVALSFLAQDAGRCTYPVNRLQTEILTSSGTTVVPGTARLSPDGRYALLLHAAAARPGASVDVALLNLDTGVRTQVPLPTPTFPEIVAYGAERMTANDGTIVLSTAYLFGGGPYKGYIVKPGVGIQPFPVDGAQLLGINAAASKVLYQYDGLHLFDLRSATPVMLLPKDRSASNFQMSHDGRRVLFLEGNQVHLLDTETLAERVVADHPDSITNAVISGDGGVAFAVTGAGGLLRINLDDGAASEWIGRTPYLDPVFATPIPGLATTLDGSALSDSVLEGTPPFDPYLGNLTMWIGKRKMPVIRLTPGSVTVLFPWDVVGQVRIMAEVPGRSTPFDYPGVETTIAERPPRTRTVARQDWQQTYVGPVNTGEIIHVYAIGFGPVWPEVPDGAAAPSQEPFARITRPLACSNAEILYAGLAPGTIERVYQIDIRIGPTGGYQQFVCTLGDSSPFIFLTLNVVM